MGRDAHRSAFVSHYFNDIYYVLLITLSTDKQFMSREPPPPTHPSVAEQNNGKSHSPNVINIDLDPERGGRTQIVTKSITLGELTDSIIAKDFSPHPFLPLRQPPFMQYHQGPIEPSDQWKKQYKHQQQQQQQQGQQHHRESPQQQQQQQLQQQPPPPSQQSGGKNSGRHVVDDRHIIRMAQPPSPLNKPAFHEPSSSPDGHFYQNSSRSGPPQPPSAQQQMSPQNAHQAHPTNQSHQFALDCYVKHRIVEAMRTEDAEDGGQPSISAHDQRRHAPHQPSPHHHQPHQHHVPHTGHHSMHHKEVDRSSTPGEMVIDEDVSISSSSAQDHRPPSGGHLQQRYESHPSQAPPPQHMHNTPVTTFATTSYPYPFSALNVSGTQVVAQLTHLEEAQKRNHQHQPHNNLPLAASQQQAEPKPLLSAQYEGISDED